jgi:hypothetical protein
MSVDPTNRLTVTVSLIYVCHTQSKIVLVTSEKFLSLSLSEADAADAADADCQS